MINKIVSGGQLGADLGGLMAAELLGISTGGMMPINAMTEAGPRYDIAQRFNLDIDSTSFHLSRSYKFRTEHNIKLADATILFGDMLSPGSKFTLKKCKELGKPFFIVQCQNDVVHVRRFLQNHKVKTLNIAGNRESKWPGIQEFTTNFIIEALNK